LVKLLASKIQPALKTQQLVKYLEYKNTAVGFFAFGKNTTVRNTSGTHNTAVG
tara:strand:+ start:199 stop:357 length:159 start_codon:yes stop_codon:yes gene_type:complete